ncbi:MAG: hypothetical protein FH756_14580 [Firmicutes bacterium]|nr:hypothetical protein [Bacillota bacterium]
MEQIINQSVKQIVKAILKRRLSSSEVVEAYLRRIVEINPKLNAIVQLCEDSARSEALRADQSLSHGNVIGPLHGVPFTLKDSFDSAGIISAGGTLGRKDFIPTQDATIHHAYEKTEQYLLEKQIHLNSPLCMRPITLFMGKQITHMIFHVRQEEVAVGLLQS